ncbi:MAG TPA: hypothetical protein VNQ14_03940 [Woeseiaceae bacterium]|nr:hypothetical protein [Woeseiaceae bacterium]
MKSTVIDHLALWLASTIVLAACGGAHPGHGQSVETTGKEATGLAAVPAEVLRAARDARPELQIDSAEHEVRNGQEYYDIAGKMPDGSELELDMTTVDGGWAVVEIQQDVSMADIPDRARQALSSANPDWVPTRIIESDQGDGVIIYEFFLGPGAGAAETKVEVKWENGAAEVLRDEWVH